MDITRWQKIIAIGAMLLLATAPAALAQRPTGDLSVVVQDNRGEALPGATVTVTGQGAPRIQVTNARGEAFFLGIDPGRVSLKAELDGFSTIDYPDVNIRANYNTRIEVALTPAVEEVITVTSESPLLDERKIQSGTTVSQIELEKIPTARDPWSLLNQTQGVLVDRINVGGNESGQQSVFLGPGVTDDENAFLVDGVEVTDMAAVGSSSSYYDFDQFTEMQFQTGGSDVSKMNSGVSVNLVTKRGTNEFRGSARFHRTEGNMFDVLTQSTPVKSAGDGELGSIPGREQAGFVGNSINEVTEYGFEGGGPVVADRVWFWGAFGVNDIKNLTGGNTLADVQSDDTILENTAFKVNAQLSPTNSAQASWNNGDKRKFGRSAGPTRPAPTTLDQRGPTAIIKAEDTHVFSSNFFLGGSWAKVDGGFSLTSKAVSAAGGITEAPETAWDANGVWQNSYRSGFSSRPQEEFKLDGSYFFSTGEISHELKFGGRLREFEVESPFAWPGRDIFHVDGSQFGIPDPFDLTVAHRGKFSPKITQEYTSAWVQDTLSSGAWTLNVGFRYDLQEGVNEADSVEGNATFPDLLPTLTQGRVDAPFDWSNISPRIGLTYALGEERKTLLRASFAQFPEQLQTNDVSRLNPLGNSYATYLFSDTNGDAIWQESEPLLGLSAWSGFDPNNPTALNNPNRTDPGLDAPLTSEALFSVEHAVLPELVVGLNATWRLTDDMLESRRLIFDPVTGEERVATRDDWVLQGEVRGVLPDGSSYSEPVYTLACGTTCKTGGFLVVNGDREVEYRGAGVNFAKRLSNRWMARGYFNYGKAEWNVPDSFLRFNDPTNTDPGATDQSYDDDGDLFTVQSAASGLKQDVIIQSTWQYNFNGMYQVAPDRPWGFNVAANVFGREGTPLPYYHAIQTSDGVAKNVQVVDDLDDFRTDDILTVDLRLEKEFAATGNVGFTVSLDAFNLFDEDFVLQRRRQLNIGNADWVTETLSPRIYRLGVRLGWR